MDLPLRNLPLALVDKRKTNMVNGKTKSNSAEIMAMTQAGGDEGLSQVREETESLFLSALTTQ